MRIAQVSTLATRVSSQGAGSVEGLVWNLARQLVDAGHEVTVFAAEGSDPPGELVATLPGPYATGGAPDDWQLCEWINLCAAVEQSDRFDVIHSHAYLWGIPLAGVSRCPMVHTCHVLPDDDTGWLWERSPDACVTAVSQMQWQRFPHLRPAAVIPHGIDSAAHTPRFEPDDYLVFLGRFTPGKGSLAAIATARDLGMPLVLAGPENAYYHQNVAPHVDGKAVAYAGPVGNARRDELLSGARALLYPIQEPEPFGLVMVEAMMSGTPAVAFDVGAVPEVVDDGVTGVRVRPGGDFAAGVRRSLALDRRRVSAHARERFTASRMTARYLEVYEQVVGARW